MTENLQETEIKVGETGKMVYIGPNIQGLLSGTVFDYMPEIENYKEYESIEKLFVSFAMGAKIRFGVKAATFSR